MHDTLRAAGEPPAAVPQQEQPRRSGRRWEFDALRVLAICGVVAIHVFGLIVGNKKMYGGTQWWIAVGIDLGLTWVVPVFVMISGLMVLSRGAHAAGPGAFYRKRFTRILPALVFWHLVYLFVVRLWINGERQSWTAITALTIDAKLYTALYFLWLIAGLYIVAPVLAAFLHAGDDRRAKVTAAVALGWTLVAFVLPRISTELGVPRSLQLNAWNMWFPYVGFFVAGFALRKVVLGRWAMVGAVVLAVVTMAEQAWQYGTRGQHPQLETFLPVGYLGAVTAVGSICVFLVAAGVGARWTPPDAVQRALRKLSDATFGVFLVHLLVLVLIERAVPAVDRADSLPVMTLAYLGVVVASFAVSMVAARIPYLRTVF